MQKRTARIENWARLGDRLVGFVFHDIHPDLPSSGEFHRTSRIVSLDEGKGICETCNTIYRLGKVFRAPPEGYPSTRHAEP